MPRLTVQLTPKHPERLVSDIDKQVQFANVLALTRIAKRAQADLEAEIRATFNRPTEFAAKSTRVKPATKADPTATVLMKDQSYKGNAADKALHQQVYGGERLPKASEKELRKLGHLGPNEFIVPAAGAKLNAYGNISRAQMRKIIQGIGKKTKGAGGYFVANIKGTRGVWLRRARGIIPVLIFIGAPQYRKRLEWYETADRAVGDYYDEEFAKAMDQAMATAK